MTITYTTDLLNSFIKALPRETIENFLGQSIPQDTALLDRHAKLDVFMCYTTFETYVNGEYQA